MKTTTLTLPVLVASLLLASACGPRLDEASGSELLAIDVSNRRPLGDVTTAAGASHYAKSNDYYAFAANQLAPGMKVMFSASYGAGGGEAGQSRGVLVEKDGGLYYKQLDNTTTQLLLPPGLTFNGGGKESLWEMKTYLDLINRIAFSEAGAQRGGPGGGVSYGAPNASLVDFQGGTAGSSVSYKDAMELKLERQGRGERSNVSVYFAKGVGAVALEFRETGAVGGTFKIYIGQKP